MVAEYVHQSHLSANSVFDHTLSVSQILPLVIKVAFNIVFPFHGLTLCTVFYSVGMSHMTKTLST